MPPKKKPSISSSKKTSLSSTKKKTSSKRKSSTLSRKSNPVKRMSIASTASKKTVSRAKKLVLVASATDGKVVKKRVASVKVTSETQSKVILLHYYCQSCFYLAYSCWFCIKSFIIRYPIAYWFRIFSYFSLADMYYWS